MSSPKRTMTLSAKPVHLYRAGFAITCLFLLPYFLSSYYVFVATRIIIIGILVMALNLVFGHAGLPSLGHAAFFGLGGYSVALGLMEWSWGFGTVIIVACGTGFLLGTLVGILTSRTEGIYLLLLTLAVGQGFWALAFQLNITRGDNGIAGISRESLPFGISSTNAYYHFVLGISLVVMFCLWIGLKSPAGRTLIGARESKSRMEALGYRVWAYRTGAFAISGLISALAGVLLVYLQGIASPEMLSWTLSAEILVMAIIGGAETFIGPVLGTLVVVVLEEFVSSVTERWMTVLGLVFICTMIVLPTGLTGLISRIKQARLRTTSDTSSELVANRIPD